MEKAALVLEGGAMRGVYTSGVLDALMKLNIEFEAVYGISAGAKNSQYYISKQPGESIKVDLYCSKNREAIGIKNFIFNGGVLNREYYDKYIMKNFAPLDKEKFNSSKQKYYIGATNCNTGDIHYFEKSSCNIRDAVAASCSMPILQQICTIDGVPYLDGYVGEAIPYKTAFEHGNKKLVLVLTRSKGYRAKPISKKMRLIYEKVYRNYPEFLEKLLSTHERYNKMLDEIAELEKEGKIFVIRPTKTPRVGKLERDKTKIENLYYLGFVDLVNCYEELLEFLHKSDE